MNKIKQLQSYLNEMEIDAAFITNPDNIFYVSGFQSNPHERLLGVMVFKEAEPFLICPQMEMPDAVNAGWTGEIIGHVDTENAMEVLHRNTVGRGVNIEKMAIEKSHMIVERYDALTELFGALEFVALDDKLNAMRVIKDESELQILREAAALADYAIEVGAKTLREGITEIEVMTEIELALKKRGVTHMSFDTTVLSGPKAASPHGKTGDRITTHDNPTYLKHDVVHYAVANMPGAVPRTSTIGLTNVTVPYAVQIANKGFKRAIQENEALKKGVNTFDGHVTYKAVAEDQGVEYKSVDDLLA